MQKIFSKDPPHPSLSPAGRGKGEGPKVTAGDVQQRKGKAIFPHGTKAMEDFAKIFLHLVGRLSLVHKKPPNPTSNLLEYRQKGRIRKVLKI
jgi:hypothetical protein